MKRRLLSCIIAVSVGLSVFNIANVTKAAEENSTVISNKDQYGNVSPVAINKITEDDITLNALGNERMNGRSQYPESIDNSKLDMFPEIRRQEDLGSCVSFSMLYFTMSHMINLDNYLNNRNEEKMECSPSFGFNGVNNGIAAGITLLDLVYYMNNSGVVSIKDFPYKGDSTSAYNYKMISTNSDMWKKAQRYSVKEYNMISLSENTSSKDIATKPYVDKQLNIVKKALTNGYVLSYETHYSPEVYTIPQTQPDGTDNKYGGENAWGSIHRNSSLSHQMVVVGYDDNVWIDLNKNNLVDEGEKGALKVADSYEGRKENPTGFHWVSYDALYDTSNLQGNEAANVNRRYFTSSMEYVIPEIKEETKLYAKYTLNTAKRGQCKLCLTATDKNSGQKYEFYPWIFSGKDQSYSFDVSDISFRGTTERCDGSFAIDLRKVVPDITSDTLNNYDWNLVLTDKTNDESDVQLKGLSIIDAAKKVEYVSDVDYTNPVTVNGSTETVAIPLNTSDKLQIVGLRNDLNYRENISEVNKPVTLCADTYGGAMNRLYAYTIARKTGDNGYEFYPVINSKESSITWTPDKTGDYKIILNVFYGNGNHASKQIDYSVYEPLHLDFVPLNAVGTRTAADGNTIYVVPKGETLKANVNVVGGIGDTQLVRATGNKLEDGSYEFYPGDGIERYIYYKDETTLKKGDNSASCKKFSFYVVEQ